MTGLPEYQLRGEIRRIVRRESGQIEVLLRIRGRRYAADDTRTFLHINVVDRERRTNFLGLVPGAEATVVIIVTARFVEEFPSVHRSLEIDRRPMRGRLPEAIRVVGYDSRITGEVLYHIDEETMILDAGIPLIVRVPGVDPCLPPPGQYVEFLLHEMPVADFL